MMGAAGPAQPSAAPGESMMGPRRSRPEDAAMHITVSDCLRFLKDSRCIILLI